MKKNRTVKVFLEDEDGFILGDDPEEFNTFVKCRICGKNFGLEAKVRFPLIPLCPKCAPHDYIEMTWDEFQEKYNAI